MTVIRPNLFFFLGNFNEYNLTHPYFTCFEQIARIRDIFSQKNKWFLRSRSLCYLRLLKLAISISLVYILFYWKFMSHNWRYHWWLLLLLNLNNRIESQSEPLNCNTKKISDRKLNYHKDGNIRINKTENQISSWKRYCLN